MRADPPSATAGRPTRKRQLGSGGAEAHDSPGKRDTVEKRTRGPRTAGGPHSLQTGAEVPITSACGVTGRHGVRNGQVPGKVHEGVCPTEHVTVP